MNDDLDPRLRARFTEELSALPTTHGWLTSPRPRSGHQPRFGLIVGVVAAVLLAIVGGDAAIGLLAAKSSSPASLELGGRDLRELVWASDAVVVGTITSEGSMRNVGRDPTDPSREDPNHIAVAQDYTLLIEESIKGEISGSITVTNARSSRDRVGPLWIESKNERYIPLTVGTRYALFLRRLPWDQSVYVLGFEPSQFELGKEAVVRSVWPDAQRSFPDRPVSEFLQSLRAASSAPR